MDTIEVSSCTESMPPKLDESTKTERLQLVAPRSLLQRINDWRRTQEPIPNVSAAIRRLCDIALDVEAQRGKK